ncbi:CPBP family intramembrane glutamic endopeptidase [Thermoanaerobacter sp. X514]|uniref:CPBP family intramembrane glutamic endopeptidase n=1 Tax=Thermoanaerobacter sp. (strain X514) TaxID=399726 RepID=UPI0000E1D926|nr:CPBP family intramembrane glutamic endopeptidase [Thermoanaerobacter sp. X514]MBZ4656666.1 Abortive infection protein [Thermoanaerobacter sp.]MDN5325274.1 protease family protein [Thermosipho sp. (in: thermotogales)]ABY91668.1 Abortive infection protein [Thermoanaerobacter sp. X514]MDI3500966.1 protease family protein [Thermoanaerobacter sp.]HCD10157.1 CPBP family intramembrane metalloprotease [Thermoanaerobacter sp.]
MKSKAKYLLITFNVFILSLFSILFISFVVSRLLGINKTWITFSSFPSNLFWIPSLILFFSFVVIPCIWENVVEQKSILNIIRDIKPKKPLWDLILSVAAVLFLLLWVKFCQHMLGLPFENVTISYVEKLKWFFHLTVLAFAEEFLIRSFLQKRLMEVLGPVLSILMSSFVFAFVLHASEIPFINLIIRFPLGIVIGFLYYIRRNIFSPFFTHLIYDFTILIGVM